MKLYVLNAPYKTKKKIYEVYQCIIEKLPTKYLGMPLFVGMLKINYWDSLVQKIRKKMMGWKENVFTYIGKTTLIKSTLQGMTIFLALVFPIPKSISKKIDQLCRNFLWSSDKD